MTMIYRARIRKPRDTFTVRQRRIQREGSPYYTWTMPATAAGAIAAINVGQTFPECRKYQPLDWLEIINNEAANDLTITINNGDSFLVIAKTIRTLDNIALWHIQVTNGGAAITTLGNIVVTLQRQPITIDQWARSQV